MKNIIYICIISIISSNYFSQDVLISDTIVKDFSKIDKNFGPNRKYYSYEFLGFGTTSKLNINNENYLPIKSSLVVYGGSRNKLKINSFLGLIYDLYFQSSWSKLYLKANPNIPADPLEMKNAKYIINNSDINLCLQFNFKPKRGNELGKYLDLGMFGCFIYHSTFKYKIGSNQLSKNTIVKINNPKYINRWAYGYIIRLGNDHIAIYGKYRISDMLNTRTSFLSEELHRASFGIEFLIPSGEYK